MRRCLHPRSFSLLCSDLLQFCAFGKLFASNKPATRPNVALLFLYFKIAGRLCSCVFLSLSLPPLYLSLSTQPRELLLPISLIFLMAVFPDESYFNCSGLKTNKSGFISSRNFGSLKGSRGVGGGGKGWENLSIYNS